MATSAGPGWARVGAAVGLAVAIALEVGLGVASGVVEARATSEADVGGEAGALSGREPMPEPATTRTTTTRQAGDAIQLGRTRLHTLANLIRTIDRPYRLACSPVRQRRGAKCRQLACGRPPPPGSAVGRSACENCGPGIRPFDRSTVLPPARNQIAAGSPACARGD